MLSIRLSAGEEGQNCIVLSARVPKATFAFSFPEAEPVPPLPSSAASSSVSSVAQPVRKANASVLGVAWPLACFSVAVCEKYSETDGVRDC